ncbi:hypothetical protein [Streptomyces sp. NPDC049555]|uniref:hypothetical protein n=1 Tax=Streptomyces sp. NPDC049555 TaxID=3154930 RepID=UPI00341B0270
MRFKSGAPMARVLLLVPAVSSFGASRGIGGSATVRFSPGLALRPRHARIGGTAAYTCAGGDPAVKWGSLNVPDCATDKGVEVVDGPSTLLFT